MKKTIKIKNLISEKNAQTVWTIHHDGDFDFTEVSFENVKKEMLNLNIKKSSTNVSIPATVLRQTVELHLSFLTKTINKSYAYEKWSLKKKTLQGRRTTELIITRFTGFQKKNLQTNN